MQRNWKRRQIWLLMQSNTSQPRIQSRAVTQTNKTAVGGEQTPNRYQQFHGLFACVASLVVMQVFLIGRGIAVSQFLSQIATPGFYWTLNEPGFYHHSRPSSPAHEFINRISIRANGSFVRLSQHAADVAHLFHCFVNWDFPSPIPYCEHVVITRNYCSSAIRKHHE